METNGTEYWSDGAMECCNSSGTWCRDPVLQYSSTPALREQARGYNV